MKFGMPNDKLEARIEALERRISILEEPHMPLGPKPLSQEELMREAERLTKEIQNRVLTNREEDERCLF